MADDQITIEIDGQALPAQKGQTVIQVADEAGIYIPRFCYHKKLSIPANCRMCLVEVEKAPKPLPACYTQVADGMKVRTRSEVARGAQKGVMEFLLINHPLDCPICDQGGECELQDLALGYGRDVGRFTEDKRVVADENIGPLVSTDMTRCIHCTRCIRVGEEIAGLRELGATDRGEHMRIGTYVEKAMVSELSGNVIDVCPVGALNNKPYRMSARAWEMVQHPAVGPHDCVGSNLYLHTLRNAVKRAVPRENEAVNETWLADRDRYGCHGLYHADRVTQPQVREKSRWVTLSWEEALTEVHRRLWSVIDKQGAGQVGALVSPSATFEEHFLLQKLMRDLGSNNIDHRLYQHDFSLDEQSPVMPWLGTDLAALENLDAALLVASNVRKDQPLAAHRLRKAALKGAKVMFANHRRYDWNYDIDTELTADPLGLVAHLGAVAKVLQERSDRQAPPGLGGQLSSYTPADEHVRVAENLLGAEKAWVGLGSQAALSPYYGALQTLACCIAELAGATYGMLSHGANAAGAWLAGAVPHRGVAGAPVAEPGLSARAMLESPRGAYLLFGVEPEKEAWDTAAARQVLNECGNVIAITGFAGKAMREYADMLLALAAFAETSGTYVNVEGRWQNFAAASPSPGEGRPGWKILRVLGNRFELPGFDYVRSEDIGAELQARCRDIKLDNTTARAGELPRESTSAGLQRISEIPIYATDALVRRSDPLQQTADGQQNAFVLIHPATAQKLDVTGAAAVVRQNGSRVELPLRITDAVPENCLWTGLGVPGIDIAGPAFGEVEVTPA